MNKEELQTLTIEQLNGMTEQILKAVADEVLEKLNETFDEDISIYAKILPHWYGVAPPFACVKYP